MGSCSGGVCGWSSCSSTSAACGGGCSGTCSGGCKGCSGSCSGGCKGCSGTCSGGCKGTCKSGCNAQCDGSTQDSNIALINNLSSVILASDFKNLKTCLDYELTRRGKSKTSVSFSAGTLVDDSAINTFISAINGIENAITDISSVVAGEVVPLTVRNAIKEKIVKAYNTIV